jgi:predicted nuclease of predicted toxin-antitoxin system
LRRFWQNSLPQNLAVNHYSETFGVNAVTLQELGLRDAQELDIFNAASANGLGTVIITKERDFVDLVVRLGSPPQILWLTCGNITNRNLQGIFNLAFTDALDLLDLDNNSQTLFLLGFWLMAPGAISQKPTFK